jgi:hypothetical protein
MFSLPTEMNSAARPSAVEKKTPPKMKERN